MSHNFITFHILNDIPWSNLNRDDSGVPKRTILGGAERGMLSSQSIKRAVRQDYESRILKTYPNNKQVTLRSRNLVQWCIDRAKVILHDRADGSTLNEKKATSYGNSVLKMLTGANEGDTVVLLSIEELEVMAERMADGAAQFDPKKDGAEVKAVIFPNGKKTGSLAVAAFGRMFANSFDCVTDAAISVSPAISTHGSLIETDYFITADDFITQDEGRGAAHLGTALYTSGVFYRSVTIDIRDLHRNWTGISGKYARTHLSQLIESILYSLPTGKNKSTAPYTLPPLIIAERQGYREAYSIEAPVELKENTGYLAPTVENFKEQFENVRTVSPKNYGDFFVSGTKSSGFSDESISIDNLVERTVDWILENVPARTELYEDVEQFSDTIEVLEDSEISNIVESSDTFENSTNQYNA